jgi:hypothetical protein
VNFLLLSSVETMKQKVQDKEKVVQLISKTPSTEMNFYKPEIEEKLPEIRIERTKPLLPVWQMQIQKLWTQK